jgi:hypothetical protein
VHIFCRTFFFPFPSSKQISLEYSPSPSLIRVTISGRVRWAGRVSHIGEMRNEYNIFIGKLEERDHSDDIGVDGIILE